MLRILTTISAIALILSGCTKPATFRQATGAAWGTIYHITYKAGRELGDSIVAEMRQVEMSLSMFDPTSRISQINSGITDSLDTKLRDVLDISFAVNRASHGLFDPTVAPLTDLWGFGRKGRTTPLPDSAAVARTLTRIGLAKCRIDSSRLIKGHPGMEFDFSAVAKGYGVDCVAAMLRRNGVTDYMVEIGGEVAVAGKNAKGRPWRIQVDAPVSGESDHDPFTVLELTDCAIASSGNYRNYRQSDSGQRLGHTINPVTGYPAVTRSIATTVVAPTCGLADALATALMITDPDSATAIINRFPSSSAIIMTSDSIYKIKM